MNLAIKPRYRAPLIGAAAAALLIGSFLLGTTRSGGPGGVGVGGRPVTTLLSSSSGDGKITVTGSGTVTGTPNQLVLDMGVQVNAASVSAALSQANSAAAKVIASLEKNGVARSDIQTSDLSIQPTYRGKGIAPVGYGVSEELTATLVHLATAGTQIQDAVTAGGNDVVVNEVSLNLTDTSGLLAQARAKAVADAQAKATQFARALHQPITGVISVSDQTTTLPTPFYAAAQPASAAPSVPVSPGSQQVTVQITVVYAIG
ncbi:MAG TPA: SIMPL domain-containing protein [Streptosporangiaceae bacterium]|nr:SIMPL domain-containing protein [Streptosporangiaceae bacterium]